MPTTMKLIAKNVLSSDTATVTFSSIPGTYTDLYLVASIRTARAANTDALDLKFNSSGTGYSWRRLEGTGSAAASDSGTSTAIATVNGNNATASTFGSLEVYIPNYAGSTNKSFSVTGAQETNATGAEIFARAHLWSNTSVITSIDLTSSNSANFKADSSFFLYGITKA